MWWNDLDRVWGVQFPSQGILTRVKSAGKVRHRGSCRCEDRLNLSAPRVWRGPKLSNDFVECLESLYETNVSSQTLSPAHVYLPVYLSMSPLQTSLGFSSKEEEVRQPHRREGREVGLRESRIKAQQCL